jgi:hypothetical protein
LRALPNFKDEAVPSQHLDVPILINSCWAAF